MALESTTYINGLVSSNPASTDSVSQADDHIRLLKATLKNTFPNVEGAVTKTHTQLNNSLDKTGDTMTGPLTLSGAPSSNLHAATKAYVDSALGGVDAGVTTFNTRSGAVTLSSGDVTGALGFTPYNSTNPSGYITSSGSITGNAATATTATTATKLTTASGSAPSYSARAWVNFNGNGSDGANQTIRGSGNIASAFKTSIGLYTITFSTSMPDANYAITTTCSSSGTGQQGTAPVTASVISQTSSSFVIEIVTANQSVSNRISPDIVNIAVFR